MNRPMRPWRRAAVVAGVAAGLTAGFGWLGEPLRFGASREETFDRVERHVRERFADLSLTLQRSAAALARHPGVPQGLAAGLTGDRAAVAGLFDLTSAAHVESAADLAITVYDGNATPRAWTGRPSELPRELILGDSSFFVASGPLGLRLAYVEPIVAAPGSDTGSRRLGSVSTERALSVATGLVQDLGSSPVESPLAPVELRTTGGERRPDPGRRVFVLESPDGEPLLDAVVASDDLDGARAEWRRAVRDALLGIVALILVLAALPELALAPRRVGPRVLLRRTALGATGLLAAGGLLWIAGTPAPDRGPLFAPGVYASPQFPDLLRSPADLLLAGLLLTVVAAIAARLADGARLVWRRRGRRAGRVSVLLGHTLAGAVAAGLLAAYETLLTDTVAGSLTDVLHSSLTPWDSSRLAVLLGLLLAATAAIWLSAAALLAADARWNRRRHGVGPAGVACWLAPGVIVATASAVPAGPYLAALAGAAAIAVLAPIVRPRLRHASQSGRLATVFACLVLPALLAYPSLVHDGAAAKRRFIETEFAPAVADHRELLLASLSRTGQEIDALLAESPPLLDMPVRNGSEPTPDAAFSIWRDTDLARQRLTSAIELYGPGGTLVSRFALNFPEYTAPASPFQARSCEWDVYSEVSPFGSQERRVLHAERAICSPAAPAGGARDRFAGAVVVHVPLDDYVALPFIPSQTPYREVLRPAPAPVGVGRIGADVELAIYGWGLSPVFTWGGGAWAIDGPLFERIYASREPFWTTLRAAGRTSDVYFSNNRTGIYALGHPVLTPFDHLVRLAEIIALLGATFVIWTIVLTAAGPFTRDRYLLGRELAREMRVSFYRRLFLAFLAVAVVPVLVLAAIIRNYSTAQLRSDIEAGARRTAVVAQRVIAELDEASGDPASVVNDDLLVFVSQVIDQDVNIFAGSRLVATSERDLFASGLLPTRTPSAVYRAIALARAPSFVSEDAIGAQPYLVAAAPIPSAGSDAILTIPLAPRQREIERQISDLDRGILLGVTLLVLLGAASGFYIAERIADPVHRLTRATQRIARGDFDARVAARSADELARLVVAFNRMAHDLAAQRRRLERTHRLEAWAEMARQVAHDIKNPLTPIQLSAEHLLRVHGDRGAPLGSVLRDCVDSILKQVRILRRISAEFSSYASSPPVTPEPTSLADLVTEVLDPYRVGLDARVVLSIDVPPTLPRLLIDRTLIGRALTNVIENALHAMPGDGRLAVSAVAGPDALDLVVRDTGVGLDEAARARIFEPYFSTKASGTGLGMAIAKRNVELNGGTIAVESRKGRGTAVTLRFPFPDSPAGAARDDA